MRLLVLIVCGWLTAGVAVAQTTPPAEELTPMALEAGTWDAKVTFPGATPEADPTHATGVQENMLRSDGFWIVNLFHVEGTPYAGSGMWGWDAATKRYVGVWGDNNEHRLRQDIGYWSPDTRTMTWRTDRVLPDGRVLPVKMVSVYNGDQRTFDIYAVGTRTGTETLMVHMDFTRRPEAPEPVQGTGSPAPPTAH